jgi:hypothetical protein
VQQLLLLRSCCHWCCVCASTTLLLTANHLRKLSPLDAAMMKSTTAAAIKICNKHGKEDHRQKDAQSMSVTYCVLSALAMARQRVVPCPYDGRAMQQP